MSVIVDNEMNGNIHKVYDFMRKDDRIIIIRSILKNMMLNVVRTTYNVKVLK